MTIRFAALAALLFATAAHAEDTQRYLVATKRPFAAVGAARNVRAFDTAFDGFAADLTSSEVARLRRAAGVRWIEPVIERRAHAQLRNLSGQTTPYGLDLIQARISWLAPRSAKTNVVVIDTGIDYRHPDLKDLYAGGTNLLSGTDDPYDDESHGTHVSGTIAAANNDFGVVGVAPDIRLWAVKVLDSRGYGSNEVIIRAVDWIIANKRALGGNWVANLSLGSLESSVAEREAFARGFAQGILFVASSGNQSATTVAFPAGYDGVMAVGAVNDQSTLATFSNRGDALDVVAPGVDVLSTVPIGTGAIAWLEQHGSRIGGSGLTGAKRGRISGEYVYCGLGKAGDYPAGVAGKIALIRRGESKFAEKTRNAMNAGAIAVAIFNHDTSGMNWTLIDSSDPTTRTYNWPVAIGVSNADGEALAARNAGTITLVNEADDYTSLSGTSMSSPHVAAAAALLWSVAPSATASEIAEALTSTAVDLGEPGRDDAYGAGVINVLEALKRLAPALAPGGPPTTGRRFLRRG